MSERATTSQEAEEEGAWPVDLRGSAAASEGDSPSRNQPEQQGQGGAAAAAEASSPQNQGTADADGVVLGTVVSPSAVDTNVIDDILDDAPDDEETKALRLEEEKRLEALLSQNQGLWNQGATCYLNSLLQLFFHISYFREAVYRMATEGDDKGDIPKALQNLFFQLQERKSASATKGLTDAFGWAVEDVMVQHDIQELAAKLRDTLETKMKGTSAEGSIDRMFKGYGEQVTATKDGTFTSKRQDTFYDVHLPVHKYAGTAPSMESLVAKDQLSGDNKYKVEEDGKPAVYKDAEMGYEFKRFPPVLMFHLKRFEMDMTSPTLDMHKINSKFAFDETIDLSEYEKGASAEIKAKTQVTELTDGTVKQPSSSSSRTPVQFPSDKEVVVDDDGAIYDLYGVIVHRGGVRSGHYYCYIRDYDHDSGKWGNYLCYDDETVTVATTDQVFSRNFGGHTYQWFNGRQVQVPNTNSAYILAYMRRSDVSKLIYPISTNAIPEHIKTELHRVLEEDDRQLKEEQERNKTVTFTLVTNESIKQHVQQHVWDLVPAARSDQGMQPNMRVLAKGDNFAALQKVASEWLGGAANEDFRLWRMGVVVQNSGIRPDTCLEEKHRVLVDEAQKAAPVAGGGNPDVTLATLFQEKHLGDDANTPWSETIYIEYKQSHVVPEMTNLINGDVVENGIKMSSTSSVLKDSGPLVEVAKNFNTRMSFNKEDKRPKLFVEFTKARPVHTISFRVNTLANEMARRVFVLRVKLYDKNPLKVVDAAPIWEDERRVESDIGKAMVSVRFFPMMPDRTAPMAQYFTLEEAKQTQLDHMRTFSIRGLQIFTHASEIPHMQLKPYPANFAVISRAPAADSLPLMIKLFNHKTASFSFLGMIQVSRFDPLSNALPSMRHLMGLERTDKSDLLMYDECKPYPLARLHPELNCTELDGNLFNGNIVTVQLHPRYIPVVYRFLTAQQMYDHVEWKRTVNFRCTQKPNDIAFVGSAQGNWNHGQIVEFIGDMTKLHPDHIRLFCPTYNAGTHKHEPEKSTTKRTLDEMLRVGQWNMVELYYEPLEHTLQQMEGNPVVNLKLCDQQGLLVHDVVKVTIKPHCNPAFMVQRLLETIARTDKDSAEEYLEESRGHFAFVLRTGSLINSFQVVNLNDKRRCQSADHKIPVLRGDRVYEIRYFIPPDEGQYTIALGHGDYRQQQPQWQPFGIPFLFNVREDEPAEQVLERAMEACGKQEVDPENVDKEYPILIYTTQMFKLNAMSEPLYGYVKRQENLTSHLTHSLICHPKPKEKPGSRYRAEKENQLNLEKKK